MATAAQNQCSRTVLGHGAPTLFGRSLQLIDLQNCFCEIAKYARVAHPKFNLEHTRIKTLYVPDPAKVESLPQPSFPPKWEINAICARSLAPKPWDFLSSRFSLEKPVSPTGEKPVSSGNDLLVRTFSKIRVPIRLAKTRAIMIIVEGSILVVPHSLCFFRSGYLIGVEIIVLLIYVMSDKLRIFLELSGFGFLFW